MPGGSAILSSGPSQEGLGVELRVNALAPDAAHGQAPCGKDPSLCAGSHSPCSPCATWGALSGDPRCFRE
eukprot:5036090-Pyramimonas_sp.AAC.1